MQSLDELAKQALKEARGGASPAVAPSPSPAASTSLDDLARQALQETRQAPVAPPRNNREAVGQLLDEVVKPAKPQPAAKPAAKPRPEPGIPNYVLRAPVLPPVSSTGYPPPSGEPMSVQPQAPKPASPLVAQPAAPQPSPVVPTSPIGKAVPKPRPVVTPAPAPPSPFQSRITSLQNALQAEERRSRQIVDALHDPTRADRERLFAELHGAPVGSDPAPGTINHRAKQIQAELENLRVANRLWQSAPGEATKARLDQWLGQVTELQGLKQKRVAENQWLTQEKPQLDKQRAQVDTYKAQWEQAKGLGDPSALLAAGNAYNTALQAYNARYNAYLKRGSRLKDAEKRESALAPKVEQQRIKLLADAERAAQKPATPGVDLAQGLPRANGGAALAAGLAPGGKMQQVDQDFAQGVAAQRAAQPIQREAAKFDDPRYWNPVYRKPGGSEGIRFAVPYTAPTTGFTLPGTPATSSDGGRLPQSAQTREDVGRLAQGVLGGRQMQEDEQEARYRQKWAEKAATHPHLQLPSLGRTPAEQRKNAAHINEALQHFDGFREQVWRDFGKSVVSQVGKQIDARHKPKPTGNALVDAQAQAGYGQAYPSLYQQVAKERAPEIAREFAVQFDFAAAKRHIEAKTKKPLTPLQAQALRTAIGWEAARLPDRFKIADQTAADILTGLAIEVVGDALTGGSATMARLAAAPGLRGAAKRVGAGAARGAAENTAQQLATSYQVNPDQPIEQRLAEQLPTGILGGLIFGAGLGAGGEALRGLRGNAPTATTTPDVAETAPQGVTPEPVPAPVTTVNPAKKGRVAKKPATPTSALETSSGIDYTEAVPPSPEAPQPTAKPRAKAPVQPVPTRAAAAPIDTPSALDRAAQDALASLRKRAAEPEAPVSEAPAVSVPGKSTKAGKPSTPSAPQDLPAELVGRFVADNTVWLWEGKTIEVTPSQHAELVRLKERHDAEVQGLADRDPKGFHRRVKALEEGWKRTQAGILEHPYLDSREVEPLILAETQKASGAIDIEGLRQKLGWKKPYYRHHLTDPFGRALLSLRDSGDILIDDETGAARLNPERAQGTPVGQPTPSRSRNTTGSRIREQGEQPVKAMPAVSEKAPAISNTAKVAQPVPGVEAKPAAVTPEVDGKLPVSKRTDPPEALADYPDLKAVPERPVSTVAEKAPASEKPLADQPQARTVAPAPGVKPEPEYNETLERNKETAAAHVWLRDAGLLRTGVSQADRVSAIREALGNGRLDRDGLPGNGLKRDYPEAFQPAQAPAAPKTPQPTPTSGPRPKALTDYLGRLVDAKKRAYADAYAGYLLEGKSAPDPKKSGLPTEQLADVQKKVERHAGKSQPATPVKAEPETPQAPAATPQRVTGAALMEAFRNFEPIERHTLSNGTELRVIKNGDEFDLLTVDEAGRLSSARPFDTQEKALARLKEIRDFDAKQMAGRTPATPERVPALEDTKEAPSGTRTETAAPARPAADPAKPAEPAETREAGRAGDSGARPLEGKPAPESRPAGEGGDAGEGSAGSRRRDVQRGDEARAEGDVVRDGVGDDARGVGVSPGERGRSRVDGPRNYRIDPERDRIDRGSKKERFEGNLAAIELLKKLEADDRLPTPEEQQTLVRYIGWGGMAQEALRYQYHGEWQGAAQRVTKLLTDDELRSARASTPNAHYTSPTVINAMWKALERMGIGGQGRLRVLEPSMGVGHFFGLLPEGLAKKTSLTGVELDDLTGRIARKLYPEADIRIQGFEKTDLPDNFYDVVISNVPFGNYPVFDQVYERSGRKFLTHAIHDYFFARGLDRTRPGGIVAFVTSRGTLDKLDPRVRQHLADRADFLGAIGLPAGAFEGNAFTSVDTDIIFLRKRPEGAPATGEGFVGTVKKTDPEKDVAYQVNEYFDRHPEMMLGEIQLIRGRHRENEATLMPTPATKTREGLQAALEQAVRQLPENVFQPPSTRLADQPARETVSVAPKKVLNNGHFVKEGKVYRKTAKGDDVVSDKPAVVEQVQAMLGIRDAYRNLLRIQVDPKATDAQVDAARRALNDAYDAFQGKHGHLLENRNSKILSGDPDLPGLLALERMNEDTGKITKADIFTRRTAQPVTRPTSAGTAKEALAIALNEHGQLHWGRMQELTGKSPEEMQQELGDLAYHDPEGDWVTADDYLSGNVRQKLKAAEAAAKLDPAFERNVAALKAVQPADLKPEQISVRLGSPWVPASDVRAFVSDLLKVPHYEQDALVIRYVEALGEWYVYAGTDTRNTALSRNTFGTDRRSAVDLIEGLLNGRSVQIFSDAGDGNKVFDRAATAAAQDKATEIGEKFKEWIWKDAERGQRLARTYNDTFNAHVLRKYDGQHLTLPGMGILDPSKPVSEQMRPHQKDAIWRVVTSGNTLFAHDVGAGKSYAAIGSAMELKRLGIAKRPLIVVPNHMTEQFRLDALRMYPGAKVLVPPEGLATQAARQQFAEQMATGDWDLIVMKHSHWEAVPVRPETEIAYLNKQRQELDDFLRQEKADIAAIEGQEGYYSRRNRPKADKAQEKTEKEIEKAIKRLDVKLERLRAMPKDPGVTWDDLGIDALFVDEADRYKNLQLITKMGRIKGVSTSEAGRSTDAHLKITHLLERNNGRTVVFMTGTPVSNSMAEMFTMMRYLQPQELKARGMTNFDAWAKTFAEQKVGLEVGVEGKGYRKVTRLGFDNLPELTTLFRQTADVITMDMEVMKEVKDRLPKVKGGRNEVVTIEASDDYLKYVEALADEAEQVRANPREHPGGMLPITTRGRKAALDMRMVNPNAPDHPGSKVNKLVEQVFSVWQETKANRGAQIIFSDLGTPTGEGFNVYDDIRKKLVKLGIPKNEVAFIHEYKKANKPELTEELFKKVRAGQVRVVIGSTEMMGAGTNMQTRLVALHHLDVPWRPRDLIQREGRIVRQGNENAEVRLFNYVTQGVRGTAGFDTFMWQLIEAKHNMVRDAMKGDPNLRSAEDFSEEITLSPSQMKALASGDPRIQESVAVNAQVETLERRFANHQQQAREAAWKLQSSEWALKEAQAHLKVLELDQAAASKMPKEFSLTVGKQSFDKKGEAGEALLNQLEQIAADKEAHVLGKYGPFTVVGKARLQKTTVFADAKGNVYTAAEYSRLTEKQQAGLVSREQNMRKGEVGLRLGQGDTRWVGETDSDTGLITRMDNTISGIADAVESFKRRIQRLKSDLEPLKEAAEKPFARMEELERLRKRQAELDLELDANNKEGQAGAIGDEEELADQPTTGKSVVGKAIEKLDAAEQSAQAALDAARQNLGKTGLSAGFGPLSPVTEWGAAAIRLGAIRIAKLALQGVEPTFETFAKDFIEQYDELFRNFTGDVEENLNLLWDLALKEYETGLRVQYADLPPLPQKAAEKVVQAAGQQVATGAVKQQVSEDRKAQRAKQTAPRAEAGERVVAASSGAIRNRADLQRALTEQFGHSADEAEAVATEVETLAQAWAKDTGRSVGEWYTTRVESVRQGGDAGDGALFADDNQPKVLVVDADDYGWSAPEPRHDVREYALFRGVNTSGVGLDLFGGGGEHWSIDRTIAEPFGRGEGGKVLAAQLKPDAKVLVLHDGIGLIESGRKELEALVGEKIRNWNFLDDDWNPEWMEKIRAAGYDAIFASNIEGPETYVLNPKALTRSEGPLRQQEGPSGPHGAIEFLPDGRAIIRALEQPNVSTSLHEIGHLARRDLYRRLSEALPEYRASIEADIKVLEEWVGETGEAWSRAAEEKFARGWERYHREGKAPTAALQPVFDRLKQWLTRIYRIIKGSPIDVKLTPEVRKVYDRLLGAERPQSKPLADQQPATANRKDVSSSLVVPESRGDAAVKPTRVKASEAPPQYTGLANRVQEAEVEQGILIRDPEKGTTRSIASIHAEGQRAVREDGIELPQIEALAADIAKGERPFTSREAGILLEGRRMLGKEANRLKGDLDRVLGNQNARKQDIEAAQVAYAIAQDRLQGFLDNVQKGKTEWHNTGMAMQALSEIEYGDFAQLAAEGRRAKGADLNDAERQRLEALSNQIRENEAKLAEKEAALKRERANLSAMQRRRKRAGDAQPTPPRDRVQPRTTPRKDAILAEIDAIIRGAVAREEEAPKTLYQSLDPNDRPQLPRLEYNSEQFKQAARKLALYYADEGMVGFDRIAKQVVQDFADRGVKLTRETLLEEMNARREPLTRTEAQQRIADLQAETREIERLEKKLAGIPTPPKAKAPARPVSPGTQRLRDEVKAQTGAEAEARKEAEALKREAARRAKRLDTARAEIANLQRQLKDGTFETPEAKRLAEQNEELLNLRAQRDLLKREIQGELNALRPMGTLEKILNGLQLPKTLMSSWDISAPGRQGWKLGLAHPLIAARDFRLQLQAMAKKEVAARIQYDLLNRPNAALYKRAGLHIAEHTGVGRGEEAFANRLPDAGPLGILARPYNASERAYVTYLNLLRADVFDQIVGPDPSRWTLDELKSIAGFVNAGSGRGGTHVASVQNSAQFMSNFFFSPRYIAAQAEYLTGRGVVWDKTDAGKFGKAGPTSGETGKALATEYFRTLLAMGVVAGFAGLVLGADIERDMASSDFGKAKFGDTRVDLMGGAGQYLTLLARLAKGEQKSSSTGKTSMINADEFGGATTEDILGRMVRSKLAPVPGAIVSLLPPGRGRDFMGRPYDLKRAGVELLLPLTPREVLAAAFEAGVDKEDALQILNFLGLSTNRYKPEPPGWAAGEKTGLPKRERDAVEKELFRLRLRPGAPSREITRDGVKVPLPPKAYQDYVRQMVPALYQSILETIQDPSYQELTDDEKRDEIRRYLSRSGESIRQGLPL